MELTAAQQQLAAAVVADNPHGAWERIFADIEIEEEDSGYRVDSISFAIVREATTKLAAPAIEFSEATRNAIVALYRERLDNAGDHIGSFEIEIDRDGQYRFAISYDQPDRLNGNWDSERQMRINNYLTHYSLAEAK